MDNTILVALVGIIAACLGAATTGFFHSLNQKQNHAHQLATDSAKYEGEWRGQKETQLRYRLLEAHKLLSKIEAEFSVTNMVMLQQQNISEHAYDERYRLVLEDMRELQAIAGLDQVFLLDDVEIIGGQMGHFWGNFKTVIYRASLEEAVNAQSPFYSNTHSAALAIHKHANSAKGLLRKAALEGR